MDPITYSVAEVSALLGVSVQHVYDVIDEGLLPQVRLGRRRLVPRWAVERLVDAERDTWDPTGARERLTEVA